MHRRDRRRRRSEWGLRAWGGNRSTSPPSKADPLAAIVGVMPHRPRAILRSGTTAAVAFDAIVVATFAAAGAVAPVGASVTHDPSTSPTPTGEIEPDDEAAEIRRGTVAVPVLDGPTRTYPWRLVVPAPAMLAAHPEGVPLVVFLHGAGERGDDNEAQLRHFVGETATASFQRRRPCMVLALQCPTDETWTRLERDRIGESAYVPGFDAPTDAMRAAGAAIDEVLAAHTEIDRSRIHLTGLSIGGYGAFDLAARRPDLFASVVPICGGGDPAIADRIAHLPIAIVHGDRDGVVPPEASRRMHRAIRDAQASRGVAESRRAMLIVYPEVGHDSWTPAYRFGPDGILDWMFSQRLAPKTDPESTSAPSNSRPTGPAP